MKYDSMIKTNIKVGDTVFWVHCSNRVYKGIVTEFDFCEDQGAVYLLLFSKQFRINNTPVVHYSHCFLTRESAMECAEWLKEDHQIIKRCSRCEFEHRNIGA